MRSLILSSVALFAVSVSGLAQATVAAGCAYPTIASTLANCKTMSAFCSSILGRDPITTTISQSTYTTTVAASTLTYSLLHQINKTTTVTLPTVTSSVTINECVESGSTGAVAAGKVAPLTGGVDAKGGSCGVGRYSTAYIASACQCDYDSTTYIAKTTKTVSGGTTVLTTAMKTTVTNTVSVVGTTVYTTTTIVHNSDNCYPPKNATCMNNIYCDSDGYSTNYYTFICGTDHTYSCYCGLDTGNNTACFSYQDIKCPAYYPPGQGSPECSGNYDCAEGSFCLTAYCGCNNPGVCVPADVCMGDTVKIVNNYDD